MIQILMLLIYTMDLLYKSQFLYDTPKLTLPPIYKF